MIAAFGFVPNNRGFGVALVENDDMESARAALVAAHGREDFVRIILLQSDAPISIVGNWCEEFNPKHASLDEIAALMG